MLPESWEKLLDSSYMPVIVNTVQMICNADWTMKPKKHDFFELVYVKKGSGYMETGSSNKIIRTNDIVILKPNQVHKLTTKGPTGCELIVLNFKFKNFTSLEISQVPVKSFLDFVSTVEGDVYINIAGEYKKQIKDLLNRILKEDNRNEPDCRFLKELLMLELFVIISRALKSEWQNSIKDESLKIKEIVGIAVEYMENNYDQPISIGDIAKFVFLSPSYFTRVFKEHIGVSPINYLIKIRIERACELLKTTDRLMGDIAFSTGFSNQQRFNVMFKKHTGLSPTEYKKK